MLAGVASVGVALAVPRLGSAAFFFDAISFASCLYFVRKSLETRRAESNSALMWARAGGRMAVPGGLPLGKLNRLVAFDLSLMAGVLGLVGDGMMGAFFKRQVLCGIWELGASDDQFLEFVV